MKRFFILFSLLFLTLAPFCPNSSAETRGLKALVELSDSSPFRGGRSELEVSLISDERLDVAKLKLRINFDSSRFSSKNIKKIRRTENRRVPKLDVGADGNDVVAVYSGPEPLSLAPGEKRRILTVPLTTKKYAEYGESEISIRIEKAYDSRLKEITAAKSDPISINVTRSPVEENKLKSLTCEQGALTPEFNPDELQYHTRVPADVKYVSFQAEPENEEARVKINRKRLGPPGSTTDITITVSGPERGRKSVYEVAVTREEEIPETKRDGQPEKPKKKGRAKSTVDSPKIRDAFKAERKAAPTNKKAFLKRLRFKSEESTPPRGEKESENKFDTSEQNEDELENEIEDESEDELETDAEDEWDDELETDAEDDIEGEPEKAPDKNDEPDAIVEIKPSGKDQSVRTAVLAALAVVAVGCVSVRFAIKGSREISLLVNRFKGSITYTD